jgi:hypothetical protein
MASANKKIQKRWQVSWPCQAGSQAGHTPEWPSPMAASRTTGARTRGEQPPLHPVLHCLAAQGCQAAG